MKQLYLYTMLLFTSFFMYFGDAFAVNSMNSDELKDAINPHSGILSSSTSAQQGEAFLDTILAYIRDSIFALLGLIAVGVFLFIGARLIVARGNPEEFKKALTSFIYAGIGIFTVALAWALVRIIAGLDI